MKKIAIIVISTLASIILIYSLVVINFDSLEKKASFPSVSEEAMNKAKIEKTSWKTAIVASETEINVSKQEVWDYWSQIDQWPEWSDQLHQSAKFTSEPSWEDGSTFEQVLNLGVAGMVTANETVGYCDPGTKVMWWKDEGGISSCHIWVFESLGANKTKVINLEVFDGNIIGLMKPFLIPDWQEKFEEGLKNLSALFQQN